MSDSVRIQFDWLYLEIPDSFGMSTGTGRLLGEIQHKQEETHQTKRGNLLIPLTATSDLVQFHTVEKSYPSSRFSKSQSEI